VPPAGLPDPAQQVASAMLERPNCMFTNLSRPPSQHHAAPPTISLRPAAKVFKPLTKSLSENAFFART
jgi:hypothetical protein